MPFAPYQWRAGTGYIPPKDSVPMSITPVYQAYACPPQAPPTYAHWIVQQPVIAAKPPAASPQKEKKCSAPPPPPHCSTVVSKASSAPKTICKGSGWRMAGKAPGKITVEIPPPPPRSEALRKEKKCEPKKKIVVCIPPPPPPSCSISPSDSISAHSSKRNGTEITLGSKKSKSKSKCTSKCCSSSSSTKTTTTEITISSSKKPSSSSPAKAAFLKLRGGDATVCSAPPPSEAPTACPTILPGVNYMFPRKKEHTTLHIFNKAAPVWEEKYEGKKMAFKMFKVTTKFTVKDVIERVLRKGEDGKGCEGWGVTECHEQGEGCWKKGTTIVYTSDKAAGSLDSMGWDAKRGKERGPVWLVVHKV